MKLLFILPMLFSGVAQAFSFTEWSCFNQTIRVDITAQIVSSSPIAQGGPTVRYLTVTDLASQRVVERIVVRPDTHKPNKILASYSGSTAIWLVNLAIAKTTATSSGYRAQLSYRNDSNGKGYKLSCLRAR